MCTLFPCNWPYGYAAPELLEKRDLSARPQLQYGHIEYPYFEEVMAALFLGGGREFEENPHEAVKWLQLGAAKGNQYCQLTLGKFYEEGRVVGKDLEQARELYRQASARAKTALEAAERLKVIEDL